MVWPRDVGQGKGCNSTFYSEQNSPSQQRINAAQMSAVMRFRNPDLHQGNGEHHGVTIGSASQGLH